MTVVRASEHPDFEKEEQYLQNTLAVIGQNLSNAQVHREAVPAYRNAALEIRRVRDEEAKGLNNAREEPYFARIDFTRDDGDSTRAIYIGRSGVKDLNGS